VSPFHDDETPARKEPVPGLPEPLPAGESLLWQGRPAPLAFAVHVFHVRFILAYLVVTIGWRIASKAGAGAPSSELWAIAASGTILGAAGLALVFGLAWLIARSALFTLTEQRIVMRYGVAIRKYVNLPLAQVVSADLRLLGGGRGDIALTTSGKGVGYIYLWPFARPMKFAPPYPSLRAIPDAEAVAAKIAETYAALQAGSETDAVAGQATAPLPAPSAPDKAPAPQRPREPGTRPATALTGPAQPA